jgi:hypothetical protein
MGLSLGMRVDPHGRLVAPPPQPAGSLPELDEEELHDDQL